MRYRPLLADMPELSHWPDRSQPFNYAIDRKVVRFNRDTKLWRGVKGGAA